jgi:hypothetical protein
MWRPGTACDQRALYPLAVTENHAEDVIEVVRDATGYAPDRLHLGTLLQVPLHPLVPGAVQNEPAVPVKCFADPIHKFQRGGLPCRCHASVRA